MNVRKRNRNYTDQDWERWKRPDCLLEFWQAAEIAGLTEKQIRARRDAQLIADVRMDGAVRIYRRDLDRYLEERRVEAII